MRKANAFETVIHACVHDCFIKKLATHTNVCFGFLAGGVIYSSPNTLTALLFKIATDSFLLVHKLLHNQWT